MKKFKIKVFIEKTDVGIYLSQLDLQKFYVRALKRSKLPVYYTQGFNPHPKLSYINALKVGQRGILEVIFTFTEFVAPENVKDILNRQFIKGLEIKTAQIV